MAAFGPPPPPIWLCDTKSTSIIEPSKIILGKVTFMSSTKPEYTRITLRIPVNVYERVSAAAIQNNRSMNAEIIECVEVCLSGGQTAMSFDLRDLIQKTVDQAVREVLAKELPKGVRE